MTMRKPEQKLYDAMRRNRPPDVRLERVENVVGDGTPDVYVKRHPHAVWVELKVSRATAGEKVFCSESKPRTSQANWHAEGVSFGVTSFFLVSREKVYYVFPGKLAIDIETFENFTVRQARNYLCKTWKEVYARIRA